jgi:coatomer protein complex subunit alpha (xenin)
LGDAQERVKVLEEAGQTALAYLTAATHGLQDDVQRLGELAEAAGKPLPSLDNVADAQLIQPPTPILRADNWPLLTVSKSALYDRGNGGEASAVAASAASANDEPISANDWGDDLDLGDDDHGAEKEDGGEPGGWDDDLDLGDDDDGPAPAAASGGDFAAEVGAMPSPGPNASMQWIAQSSHAADHVAAGSFESAMQLLHRQIAAVQFVPLKARFLVVLAASGCVLPGFPLSRSNSMPLSRRSPDEPPSKAGELALPIIAVKMANLVETLKSAYKLFQKGQFKESKDLFQDILLSIPLVVASNRAEAAEVKELLEISREYITAVRIKLLNGSTAPGPRQMELSAYFTWVANPPSCGGNRIAGALSNRRSRNLSNPLHLGTAACSRRTWCWR